MTVRAPIGPILAYLSLVAIWGTTWLVIKIGYEETDALWGAALRFFVASAVLSAVVLARGGRLVPRTREAWITVALVGIVFFFGEYSLLYWGEQFLTSGLTAVLFATTPLFTGAIGALGFTGDRWTRGHLAGSALGLAGVLLIFHDQVSLAGAPPLAVAAILGCAFAAAAGSVILRRRGGSLDLFEMNAAAMLVGALALLAGSFALGERWTLPASATGWLPIAYLAVLGTSVTFVLYAWLVRRWSAERASTLTFLTPVVAVVMGAAVRAEALTPYAIAGTGAVLLGAVVALRAKRATRPIAPVAPTAPVPRKS